MLERHASLHLCHLEDHPEVAGWRWPQGGMSEHRRVNGAETDAAASPVPGGAGIEARRLGIDTHHEPVVVLRADAPVCRAEGFEAHARIEVVGAQRSIIATLNILTTGELLDIDEAGLSESAWTDAATGAGRMPAFPPSGAQRGDESRARQDLRRRAQRERSATRSSARWSVVA